MFKGLEPAGSADLSRERRGAPEDSQGAALSSLLWGPTTERRGVYAIGVGESSRDAHRKRRSACPASLLALQEPILYKLATGPEHRSFLESFAP